jgi:hypothetical protein
LCVYFIVSKDGDAALLSPGLLKIKYNNNMSFKQTILFGMQGLKVKQEIVLVALFEGTANLLVRSVQADASVALYWPEKYREWFMNRLNMRKMWFVRDANKSSVL